MDVLILYEKKSRELENVSLLSVELEKRGYSVCVKNIYSPFKYFTKPKVIVVPHLYDEWQLVAFTKNIWLKNVAIIDLQYEQILGNDCDPITDVHSPKGQAKFAHHIAWGEDQARRYKLCGIADENIHITGSMAMDLMRREFEPYFFTREQVGAKFGLDLSKEWVIFISSFSYANRTEEELKTYEKMDSNAREFSRISNESFEEIFKWLKNAAENYPNKIFIYRPHPAEKIDSRVLKLASEQKNFFCIEEYSMRQWAKIVDRVYNWYSTSIADIYFARKTCYILRPVPIEKNLEVSILTESSFVENYDDFVKSLSEQKFSFPIDSQKFEFFYGNGKGRMAYLQVADLCEKLIKGKLKTYQFDYGSNRLDMCNLKSFRKYIINWMNLPFYTFCYLFKISKPLFFFRKKKYLLSSLKKDVYGAADEINAYKKRFRSLV